ncbi:unnamed protein product [Dibothriocephalus latus]|uniref:Di19 zinc-binding domain-containing protein n=1 Tax=Dibothriocephalus latus TaxID=60516 RepID=A0A3P7MKW4_DIBLA|nr:unnamed protein product [Dibothriocephalus latus]
MGFREAELATHVFTEHPPGHPSSKTEVICPICASSSDGSPNLQTQSFAQHLTSKHRLKKLTKPASSAEEDAAPKSATQSSAASSRSSHRSHPLLPHVSSSSANPSFPWNVFGSPCNSQRNSLATAAATADDELTHLFSLQSVRKVLTTSPRRLSTSDRSKCLQVTPSFSVGKAPPPSSTATRRLSNSSLPMEKNATETTASSTAPAVALNGATASTSERKPSPPENQASKDASSSDPPGDLNAAQTNPNTSMPNLRVVNTSNDTATNFPQNSTDRQAQNVETGPSAGIIDDNSVSLKASAHCFCVSCGCLLSLC